MGKINSRAKGQRGEREVVDLFIDLMFGVETELTDNGLEVPFMSQDLRRNAAQWHAGGHDIVGTPMIALEVKFVETEFQAAWWSQCVAQARAVKALPVLFFRRSRAPWQVMTWGGYSIWSGEPQWVASRISGKDFLTVYRKAYAFYLTSLVKPL